MALDFSDTATYSGGITNCLFYKLQLLLSRIEILSISHMLLLLVLSVFSYASPKDYLHDANMNRVWFQGVTLSLKSHLNVMYHER